MGYHHLNVALLIEPHRPLHTRIGGIAHDYFANRSLHE
jgi:hypothetical protein